MPATRQHCARRKPRALGLIAVRSGREISFNHDAHNARTIFLMASARTGDRALFCNTHQSGLMPAIYRGASASSFTVTSLGPTMLWPNCVLLAGWRPRKPFVPRNFCARNHDASGHTADLRRSRSPALKRCIRATHSLAQLLSALPAGSTTITQHPELCANRRFALPGISSASGAIVFGDQHRSR